MWKYILIGLVIVITLIVLGLCLFRNPNENLQIAQQTETVVDMGDHKTVMKTLTGEQNKTLFLIHGYPFQQEQWSGLIDQLVTISQNKPILSICTYDLRGCGSAYNVNIDSKYLDTDIHNSAWTIDDFYNDFMKIYNKASEILASAQGKIQIGGWGFGAILAQYIAVQNPSIIDRVYLFQPDFPMYSPMIVELSEWCLNYPDVSYLSLPADLISQWVCNDFGICSDSSIIPTSPSSSVHGQVSPITPGEENNSVFYETLEILRGANARAALQVLKLASVQNIGQIWSMIGDTSLQYSIYVLSADQDVVSSPNNILRLYNIIKNKPQSPLYSAILNIVSGKHYFTFTHSEIIASIIIGI